MEKICDICHSKFNATNKKSHICNNCKTKQDLCPICGKPKSIFTKTCSKSCGAKLKANKNKIKPKKINTLSKLQNLISAGVFDDFEEMPVSFEEFITNKEYLGNAWVDQNGDLKAFPFWIDKGKEIFPLPMRSPYHTILLEGGTGLGKTSFAVNMIIAYYLYIVMCLKNPHEYFDLADQKKITFAFLNIVTKTIAYKNAWGMLHKSLIASPWFMARGDVTSGRTPEWFCTTKPIDLLYGSSANDVIGLDILCLTGDTEILTEFGWRKIEDLEKQYLRVETYNSKSKKVELSDTCYVLKTKETSELFEIELEDGSKIRCTPEHRFLLKTGEYKAVKDLDESDKLEDGNLPEMLNKSINMDLKRNEIKFIKKISLEKPVAVYDVINAAPNNNFFVKTKTSQIVSHNCCFLDEISFARIRNVQAAQERAMELFDAAHERMQSRYTKFGGLYEGLMIMASSKRTDQAFLEVFMEKLISESDRARVMIIDKPRWEVLPKGTYCGKTFPFAVGDKFLPSQIIKENQVDEFKELGYKIIYPPIETYGNFDKNMMKAMTDIAGISVMNQMTFLRGDKIRACINKNRQNPFVQSIIYVGCNDKLQYYDFFDMSRVDIKDRHKPLCIHLDASLGNDGNAISGTVVEYAQYQKDLTTGQSVPELHYKQIFKIKVKAPKGDKVMLSKNYQFIMWLRQQGFNIKLVTHDQYQAFQFGQDLTRQGFNVSLQSIDRVTNGVNQPYSNLQTVIYEKRIDLLDDDDQTNELVALELHEDGRVDKPVDGFDDASQALCGSVYGCSSLKAEYLKSNNVLLENTTSDRDYAIDKEMPDDLVASLLANQFGDFISPNIKTTAESGIRSDFDKYVSKNNNKGTLNNKSALHIF